VSARPLVGVLALQGDVREHLRALDEAGATPRAIRRPQELVGCVGLVLPGGESTTMVKLARTFELWDPMRELMKTQLPMFGTCAGMILLARRIVDGAAGQETLGGLDVTVRRNAFGRQSDSFETDVNFVGLTAPIRAVFIRAPWVESSGKEVEKLAQVTTGGSAARVVAVRQGRTMATSFHPEVVGDCRVHEQFIRMVRDQ
jgi:pyridoxal 5'-phosphate synthase pdxT subunit